MIRLISDALLSLAYPRSCQICENLVSETSNGVVCQLCWDDTNFFDGNETLCEKCGQFLRDKPSKKQTFCRRCDEHFYDGAWAIGKYDSALSASILNLKREPIISKKLKNLILEGFQSSQIPDVSLIVPVPLSKRRLLERGFNQATVIGKLLANETGIPIDEKSLVRVKHTPVHRAGMDKRGRELSVAKAFEVTREKLILDQQILLVDDVFTSGATASMCAKVLKKKGASKVFVFTIAHTI